MGAVFYNQAVDGYLDEYLGAAKKPNDKPYKKGAAYTGKEHAWDEAFGYFGTPAHTLQLTPKQVYDIAKRKDLAAADRDKDGKVDLKTEMTFGPAYYAAGFDRLGLRQGQQDIVPAHHRQGVPRRPQAAGEREGRRSSPTTSARSSRATPP